MSKDNPLPKVEDFLNTSVKDDADFILDKYIDRGCYALVFRGYSKSLNQFAA